MRSIEEIIEANINYCKTFDLNITDRDKLLPIMYWLPEMYKTIIVARFIVISKNCSAKPLSDTISEIFKIIFNTVESFHNITFFYSACQKFWVAQNYFPIVTKLHKMSRRKAKSISTFDFST